MEETTEEKMKGFAEGLAQLIEKLAGKETDFELNFKDLTVEVGGLKARLNGSIVLDIVYVAERK